MKFVIRNSIILIMCSALMISCARDLSSDTYVSQSTLSLTLPGTIIAARSVKIKDKDKLEDNKNGGFNGKIVPPHTYYFRKEFFENLNFNLIDLNIYSQIKFPHPIDDEGEIIRYIGKK